MEGCCWGMGENQPRKTLMGGASGFTAIGLALAVVIGIQLGGIPWRYRKQLWQLQGAAHRSDASMYVG